LMAAGSDSAKTSAILIAVAGAASMFTLAPSWACCIDIGEQRAGVLGAAMNTSGNIAGALSPASPGCLSAGARGAIAGGAFGAASAPILASLDRLAGINGTGAGIDRYRQRSRNYALFTHNVFNITDRLSLTAGIRYTNERKKLLAEFNGSPGDFAACAANAAALNPFLNAPGVAPLAQAIFSFSCLPLAPVPVGTSLSDTKKEDEFTGTAVISFKPTDELMTYASYSKGYKAGGFNLDRSPLGAPFLGGQTLSGRMLRFEPEKVDAFEIGAKFNGRGFDLNVAAFYQLFDDFQLNAFTGTSWSDLNRLYERPWRQHGAGRDLIPRLLVRITLGRRGLRRIVCRRCLVLRLARSVGVRQRGVQLRVESVGGSGFRLRRP